MLICNGCSGRRNRVLCSHFLAILGGVELSPVSVSCPSRMPFFRSVWQGEICNQNNLDGRARL